MVWSERHATGAPVLAIAVACIGSHRAYFESHFVIFRYEVSPGEDAVDDGTVEIPVRFFRDQISY